ncbi:ABC transporter permease subunit [Rhodoferax sp. GW822-FHT02A01]|uniref:ABC transporter permease n=1 Tax=Rhodoferax sp. GW822-FHT02A01 TaxID=3141537 RepID=UPI00315CC2A6
MDLYELFLGSGGWARLLCQGALLTVAVAAVGLLIGAALGIALAFARVSGGLPLRLMADAYTTVLRGVPDLLVIYLLYFGGSSLLSSLGNAVGATGFIGMPSFATGVVALGLVSAAYQAEVYRGAYQALPWGELEAARACGMRPALMFRRVIAPQVLRHALPGLANVWQLVVKESALISVIGLVELMRASQLGAGSTRMPFVFYAAALCLYLVITSVSGYLFLWAESVSFKPYRRA